jgi:hypothetical protein
LKLTVQYSKKHRKKDRKSKNLKKKLKLNNQKLKTMNATEQSNSAKLGYIQGVLLAVSTLYRDSLGEEAQQSVDTALQYSHDLSMLVMNAEVERKMKEKAELQG